MIGDFNQKHKEPHVGKPVNGGEDKLHVYSCLNEVALGPSGFCFHL